MFGWAQTNVRTRWNLEPLSRCPLQTSWMCTDVQAVISVMSALGHDGSKQSGPAYGTCFWACFISFQQHTYSIAMHCLYSPRFAWGGRPHRRFISVRERGPPVEASQAREFSFFPPVEASQAREFSLFPPVGASQATEFSLFPREASQAKNFHFPPPWGLPKLGNFHFSPLWGFPS